MPLSRHVCGWLIEHGDEGFELKARDVGPAAAALHRLEQIEELLAVFRQAAAECIVLNAAVQCFQAAQQSQQGFRIAPQVVSQASQSGEQSIKPILFGLWQCLSLGTGGRQRDGLFRAAKG